MTRPLSAAFMFALVACAKDPTAGKSKAQVSEAKEEKAAPAGAETLTVKPGSSHVGFVGAKVTAKHVGAFEDFSGTISLVDGAPEKSQVTFEVKTASLTVDPEHLQDHLKSPDFFDVEKFPTATFKSTEIEKGSDAAGMNYTVTGNLTIRGVKVSVKFPASIEVSNDAVKVKTEFGINRKDFGIVYPGVKDDLIKDNVLITIDLEAPRAPRT